MRRKSRYIKQVLNLVLIFFCILSGGGVIFVLERNIATAFLAIYVIVLFFLFKPRVKRKLIKAYFAALFIVFVSLLICYFFSIKPQDPVKYLTLLLLFMLSGTICIYLFSSFTYTGFLKLLYRALRLNKWHSILCGLLMPFLLGHSFKVTNTFNGFEAFSFANIFYLDTSQYAFNLFGFTLYRNQGLFWEPGVLQFYLNLLLFLQLYVIKTKRFDLVTTFFAILITYSTTAYALMLLILSVYLIKQVKRKPVIVIGALALLGGLVPIFIGNFQNKLQGEQQNSSLIRLYDLTQQALLVKDHPLTGVGIDDQAYEIIRSKYLLSGSFSKLFYFNGAESGSTNSIMFLLGATGIFIGGFWLYAYIKQGLIQEQKWLISIFLLLAVMVEPLLLKPFFLVFMFSGFMALYYKWFCTKKDSLWKTEF